LNPNSEFFDVVKQARSWLINQDETRTKEGTRTPNPDTLADYRLIMNRLLAKGDPWVAAADTTKKSTYFKRRAAILHTTREVIESRLKLQDQLQRNNGLNDPEKHQQWVAQVKAIKNAMLLVEKIPDQPSLKNVVYKATKRKNLGKLPENWREILIGRMPNYETQVVVCALCGCRPGELEKFGVSVSMRNFELKVRVQGAKFGPKSGQKWRELVWKMPTENPLAMKLGRLAMEKGGDLFVQLEDARKFSGAMRSAGQRAFPDFSETITPYSLRHQLSSDMKASGLSGDDISAALGHRSAETKSSYGLFSLGFGSMAPDRVAAARPVKASTKPGLGLSNPRTGPMRP
jgi:integrase